MKRIIVSIFIFMISLFLFSCDENQYTVTFDGDGGTLISGKEIQVVKSIDEIEYPIYKKEGYEFLGFDQEIKELKSDVKLIARWNEKTYKITFDGDGGTLISGKEAQVVKSIDEIEYPIYEKEGYEFLGFDQEIKEINGDIIVKALYEKKEEHVVRFVLDESNGRVVRKT